MAAHPYSLRSRLNGNTPSIRTNPSPSPLLKATKSPRKPYTSSVSIHLAKVVGTTTTSPPGLASCPAINSYAYCAGAVVVLTTIFQNGDTVQKHYKARPTALSINPSSSHYDTNSPSNTPLRRRTSIFSPRKTPELESSLRDRESDGSPQTWTARERIKTVTCVDLSADGRWLAVGESGYSPRVLLFSTADNTPTDVPTSIVQDHVVGVRCVAFSPDGKFLATLGNINDGFLFIWSLNSKTGSLSLHSTNKCTTNICGMTWCGQHLVTVGTRHVKVWQMGELSKPVKQRRFSLRPKSEEAASPGPATLQGRNALLGALVDCIFTSVAAIDQQTIVVGTESGQLCYLDAGSGSQELKTFKTFDFGLNSIAWQADRKRLILATEHGIVHEDFPYHHRDEMNIDRPKSPQKTRRTSSIRQTLGLPAPEPSGVSAVACLSSYTVRLDIHGNVQIDPFQEGTDVATAIASPCHADVLQGVRPFPERSEFGSFFTWTRGGEVKFWDTGGSLTGCMRLPLDEADLDSSNDKNELKSLAYDSIERCFVMGDRLGVLKLVRIGEQEALWQGRAHGAEIIDITIHDQSRLMATCSRDRMIQLFSLSPGRLEILQTMDDHIGAVTQMMFTSDAQRLISCSADRTVVIRDRAERQGDQEVDIAYLSAKSVALRSTPVSMTFTGNEEMALISTMDRYIVKVDLANGTVLETVKVIDPENDDTVVLSSLAYSRRGSGPEEVANLLMASSGTDKSIRVYDADRCNLLTRDCGHTEGISDMCLIETIQEQDQTKRTLVSTGLDGTMMIWSLVMAAPTPFTPMLEPSQVTTLKSANGDNTPTKASPASLPPLRRVLSKSEVLEFSPGGSGFSTPASSPRNLSPARLTRKRSNLTMSATINEHDEDDSAPVIDQPEEEIEESSRGRDRFDRSPSPMGPTFPTHPKKQRSRSEVGESETRSRLLARSPSPPAASSSMASAPTTPRHRASANNSRLRRPPSVPTDLRSQSLAQGGRRKSTASTAGEWGSIGTSTESAKNMLRSYRKRLEATKEHVVLDEIESELERVLNLVRQKKNKSAAVTNDGGGGGGDRRLKAKAATEGDVDALVTLMDNANIADRAPLSTREGVLGKV